MDCQDCNSNGVPDSCDLASGACDSNDNGIPDHCEASPCDPPSAAAYPQADVNCDGIVTGLDIAIIKNSCNFGLPAALAAIPHADVNRDGIVTGLDVAVVASSACFGQ